MLVFIDPACGEPGFLPSAAPPRDLARAITGRGASAAVAVCAPGLDPAIWRAASRGSAPPHILPDDASREFIAALSALLPSGGADPDPLLRLQRAEYRRGRGAAAQCLLDLFRVIRSGPFPFDLVLTAGAGQAASLAAAAVGARFARLHTWPLRGQRWRAFGFVESRDAAGRSAMDGMTAEHLRASDLSTLPAAFDQRLLGHQREINPWESAFAPLRGPAARCFSTDRRIALLAFGESAGASLEETGSADTNRTNDPTALVRGAIPRLLNCGWRVIALETSHSTALSSALGHEIDHVYVLPADPEPVSKRDRRARLALLAQADLLITDDSGLALEAAVFERPVCLFGRSLFNLPGLFPTLDHAVDPDFESATYRADLALLRTFLFRCWGAPRADLIAGRRLLERVLELDEVNDRCVGDTASWLRGLNRLYGSGADKAALASLLKREGELEPMDGS